MMAKQKYVRKRIAEITGVLDKDETGYVVSVDSVAYDLEDIIQDMLGQEITIKTEIEE